MTNTRICPNCLGKRILDSGFGQGRCNWCNGSGSITYDLIYYDTARELLIEQCTREL